MKIGVCGIACEKCPRLTRGTCPNGEMGCKARESKFCKITSCASRKGIQLCFECQEFPCEFHKEGPISYGYCLYIADKKA
jgi:hypothetical protein